MITKTFLTSIERYYTDKLEQYGPSARGVDWNGSESQQLRFDQLLKVCDLPGIVSLNDYGCGYGALVDHLLKKNLSFTYCGYDISPAMINAANELHKDVSACSFSDTVAMLTPADYTVASGIFNVKLEKTDSEWRDYIVDTLEIIASLSKKGFSFNCLSRYSDPEYQRSYLYYADPLFLFDLCKTRYSRFVSLIHDYPLYEFSILVFMENT
nr:class I SAM-dependent methyltransferase [Deltaproteobacteria bacterium]